MEKKLRKKKNTDHVLLKKFGRLTVLEVFSNEKGVKTCRCLCECGSIKEHNYNSLISGGINSCGCGKMNKYREIIVKQLMELDEPFFSKEDFLSKIYSLYKFYKRKKTE